MVQDLKILIPQLQTSNDPSVTLMRRHLKQNASCEGESRREKQKETEILASPTLKPLGGNSRFGGEYVPNSKTEFDFRNDYRCCVDGGFKTSMQAPPKSTTAF